MFVANAAFCLLFFAFGVCEAGFADSLEKCSLSDGECQTRVLETTIHDTAETGLPEYDIPPLKPYKVKDASVSILGLVDISVSNGLIEGMSNCQITDYKIDIDEEYTATESFCDQITLNGHYRIVSGPLLSSITGNSLSGDGNGQIQINKMILKMKIPFNIEKHDDGEIYIVPDAKESEYSTEVTENITFAADNVIVGGEDVSNTISNYMNKNWRFILKSFGKFFSDKIMELYYKGLQKFFGSFPAKYYIVEDLSSYAN